MDITRVVKGVERANFVYCECLANSAMGEHSRYLCHMNTNLATRFFLICTFSGASYRCYPMPKLHMICKDKLS